MRTDLHGIPGRVLALSLLLLAISIVPAHAGEARLPEGKGECLSSRMANDLLECEHCQAMKRLLNHRSIGDVSMEVHELDAGAIVEIEAADDEALELVHSMVEAIWNTETHCETELSTACQARFHHLGRCDVDRALTSHGALVVLRGDSPEDVAWLLEDARNTRSYLLAAASR